MSFLFLSDLNLVEHTNLWFENILKLSRTLIFPQPSVSKTSAKHLAATRRFLPLRIGRNQRLHRKVLRENLIYVYLLTNKLRRVTGKLPSSFRSAWPGSRLGTSGGYNNHTGRAGIEQSFHSQLLDSIMQLADCRCFGGLPARFRLLVQLLPVS